MSTNSGRTVLHFTFERETLCFLVLSLKSGSFEWAIRQFAFQFFQDSFGQAERMHHVIISKVQVSFIKS